jgi:hypothetical protein
MIGSGHIIPRIIAKEMNRSGQAQKPLRDRSYFVLYNTPSSDYISDLYPGRRPNPAPLIDIVKRNFAMPVPVQTWKPESFSERLAA